LNVYINIYFQVLLGMANNEKATLNYIRLSEDFWAFTFELFNAYLFQQKCYQLDMTMRHIKLRPCFQY